MPSVANKILHRLQGLVWGDGVKDSALYLDGHTLVADLVSSGRAADPALQIRGLDRATNAPTTLAELFKDGSWVVRGPGPWVNVRAFGAEGDGVADDSAAVQAAIDAVEDAGGGTVFVPAGNYSLIGGIVIPPGVRVVGAGQASTTLQAWHTDVRVVQMSSGGICALENVTIYGKGTNSDTGTFGATLPALTVSCQGGTVRNVTVWGGSNCIATGGVANVFENVSCNEPYGSYVCLNTGANVWLWTAFNQSSTGITVANSRPWSAWAATTAYTVGHVVTTGGYAIQCSVAGTSGGTPPTLKNYGLPMVDGTATWVLLSEANLIGHRLATGAGENHFTRCDFSGSGTFDYAVSVAGTAGTTICVLTDCVLSAPVSVNTGKWVSVRGCEIVGTSVLNGGYTGIFTFADNCALGTAGVLVGTNVGNFVVSDNYMGGGTIEVSVGTSDHYVVRGNVSVTVTDGGTGVNKSVTGNVA